MFAQLGMTMSWIALTWLVLRETGSATNIGLVLAAYPVAQMITSPFIGIVLDRWPRKILMLFDNVAQLVLYALIPVVEWFIRIPFLFYLSFSFSPVRFHRFP
ncbi:MFS transporter [Alicyclobacillus pomorum]